MFTRTRRRITSHNFDAHLKNKQKFSKIINSYFNNVMLKKFVFGIGNQMGFSGLNNSILI